MAIDNPSISPPPSSTSSNAAKFGLRSLSLSQAEDGRLLPAWEAAWVHAYRLGSSLLRQHCSGAEGSSLPSSVDEVAAAGHLFAVTSERRTLAARPLTMDKHVAKASGRKRGRRGVGLRCVQAIPHITRGALL